MASETELTDLLIKPMCEMLLPPGGCKDDEAKSRVLLEYLDSLKVIPSVDLPEIWRVIKATHTARSWPSIAAILKIASRVAHERTTAEGNATAGGQGGLQLCEGEPLKLPNGRPNPRITDDAWTNRFRLADQLLATHALGQRARAKGLGHGFVWFVRQHARVPNKNEWPHVERYCEGFLAELQNLRNTPGDRITRAQINIRLSELARRNDHWLEAWGDPPAETVSMTDAARGLVA